jgi:hypothetical protein
LASEEGRSKDYEDNQFSPRKIEEAIVRGLRSGLDKVYLVAPNEEMAKSVRNREAKIDRHSKPKGQRERTKKERRL